MNDRQKLLLVSHRGATESDGYDVLDMSDGWIGRWEHPGYWSIEKEGELFLVTASDADNQKIRVEVMSPDLSVALHVESIEVGAGESWRAAMGRAWDSILQSGLHSTPKTVMESGAKDSETKRVGGSK